MTNYLTNLTSKEVWSLMYAALCKVGEMATREAKDAQWAIVEKAKKTMNTAEKLEENNFDWEKPYEHLKDGYTGNTYRSGYDEEWYEVA